MSSIVQFWGKWTVRTKIKRLETKRKTFSFRWKQQLGASGQRPPPREGQCSGEERWRRRQAGPGHQSKLRYRGAAERQSSYRYCSSVLAGIPVSCRQWASSTVCRLYTNKLTAIVELRNCPGCSLLSSQPGSSSPLPSFIQPSSSSLHDIAEQDWSQRRAAMLCTASCAVPVSCASDVGIPQLWVSGRFLKSLKFIFYNSITIVIMVIISITIGFVLKYFYCLVWLLRTFIFVSSRPARNCLA